eukprot:SAG22_NODE_177_length_16160_cov_41.299296_13_plen_593_part_00
MPRHEPAAAAAAAQRPAATADGAAHDSSDEEEQQLLRATGDFTVLKGARGGAEEGGGGPASALQAPAGLSVCRARRWRMCALCCAAWVVAYSDRTNISLAILAMERCVVRDCILGQQPPVSCLLTGVPVWRPGQRREYGFSAAVDGMVLSAFFAGYLCTQVLGGWAAARYGGKPVLTLAVLLWSVFTLVTPAAAAHSVAALLAARFALGLGEGLALPCMQHLCAQWAPPPERSRFVAAVTSGQQLGTALALIASPLVAVAWPLVFYLFAGAGAAWLLLWRAWGASTPLLHTDISAGELEYILAHTPHLQADADRSNCTNHSGGVPWRRLLSEPSVLVVIAVHFCHNYFNYICLSWLPKYLVEAVGVPISQSGMILLLPYMAQAVGGVSGGQLADWLLRAAPSTPKDLRAAARDGGGGGGGGGGWWTVQRVRLLMEACSSLVPAGGLVFLVSVERPTVAQFVVTSTVMFFFAGFSMSGYLSNMLDLAPRHAGALMGISNTVATLPGVFGNILVRTRILRHCLSAVLPLEFCLRQCLSLPSVCPRPGCCSRAPARTHGLSPSRWRWRSPAWPCSASMARRTWWLTKDSSSSSVV